MTKKARARYFWLYRVRVLNSAHTREVAVTRVLDECVYAIPELRAAEEQVAAQQLSRVEGVTDDLARESSWTRIAIAAASDM